MPIKGLYFAFAFAGLLGIAATAHAESPLDQTHQRHDEVSDRVPHQNEHVEKERHERTTFRRPVHVVHRDDRAVRAEGHSADGHSVEGHSAEGHSADRRDGEHPAPREQGAPNSHDSSESREIVR